MAIRPLFPTSTPIRHLQRLDYGNGDRVQYTYDNKGRVTGQTYEVGRFINADAFVSTGQGFVGNNMFAYCNNNPVMYTDSLGTTPEWWQWAISGVMVVAGVALVATGVGVMPLISTTTKALAKSISTGWSIITEAVVDFFNTIIASSS